MRCLNNTYNIHNSEEGQGMHGILFVQPTYMYLSFIKNRPALHVFFMYHK